MAPMGKLPPITSKKETETVKFRSGLSFLFGLILELRDTLRCRTRFAQALCATALFSSQTPFKAAFYGFDGSSPIHFVLPNQKERRYLSFLHKLELRDTLRCRTRFAQALCATALFSSQSPFKAAFCGFDGSSPIHFVLPNQKERRCLSF